jgi:superoxide dismutase, Fe-Mn family
MPNSNYTAKPLPFDKELVGISKKTIEIHHDKLYAGYVTKMNEVGAKLAAMRDNADALAAANQTYSDLRALRSGETFATNGVYLHEYYFDCLGGEGKPSGALVDAISAKWGSLEKFIAYFTASGMAMRGWVVLCWNTKTERLNIYGCDSHDQGGVWGCIPLIVLDVYEHAYFIDYGSDRKKYIADFWANMNWTAANAAYEKYSKLIA